MHPRRSLRCPSLLVGRGSSAVAWPLSRVLDWWLGKELGNVYTRKELKELFSMQAETVIGAFPMKRWLCASLE